MANETETTLKLLAERLAAIPEVRSIGLTGKKSPLPGPGEGDIDIVLYCSEIPSFEARRHALEGMGDAVSESKVGVYDSKYWGRGDFTSINGVETWLMYYHAGEADAEVNAILNGDYPDRLDNYYYPVGRCAMLRSINILCDKDGYLESMKARLAVYPEKLAVKLSEYHLDKLSDFEDLERAVSRKDVLFYHFALDRALDHFLQALFARNRTYFPSRKRSMEYIDAFMIKPSGCAERLLAIIKAGAEPAGIALSYGEWRSLLDEFVKLSA